MKSFYHLLSNVLISGVTNSFVWFALTFWAYLETKSVLTTSIISGIFLVATALSSIGFGSFVDHNKKKYAMLFSSLLSLSFFIIGLIIYLAAPNGAFSVFQSYYLWALVLTLMIGVTAGNIRNIALPTLTTIMVKEKERDKANGLSGMVMGIAFSICSFASGLVLSRFGMFWVIVIGIIMTMVSIVHLITIKIKEGKVSETEEVHKKVDLKGTIKVISAVPGLFALIFFTTFNNFLGGVFMSLMDAYGLSLVSVEVWGFLWGFLSLGFIIGGLFIAKYGLGKNPLKQLFLINIILWTVTIFFTIQTSIILTSIGLFIWICLVPFVEAIEHTIIQKVVPVGRQGRVFGFAQSIEQAASPITAFLIGPIAQFIFIPFMTNGAGVNLIGDWFGVGMSRGIALVFTLSGILGLTVTLIAMRSRAYKLLFERYTK